MKALEEEIKGIEVAMVEDQTFCISVHYQYIYCSSAGVYLKSDQLLHFETDAVDPKNRHRRKLETESLLESSKFCSEADSILCISTPKSGVGGRRQKYDLQIKDPANQLIFFRATMC
ncbi:hypothetical protein ACLB2K_073584 [Fragaria x ananassa]